MGKLKASVLILLTASVLVAGAWIPKLVAGFLDQKTTGKSTLSSMAPVELDLRRELSPAEKLVMMSRIDSLLPIQESKAAMSREEVLDTVLVKLTPYTDSQLAVLRDDLVEMRPYLVRVPQAPELQHVVWQVTISCSDTDFTFWDLILDDETGNILRVGYTEENPRGVVVGMKGLELFADIFFSGLGIEDPWSCVVPDLDYAYTGDNGNALRFRFTDTRYGEAIIDLNVHDHGFYAEYPHS